jgi:hypothetical protein
MQRKLSTNASFFWKYGYYFEIFEFKIQPHLPTGRQRGHEVSQSISLKMRCLPSV